MTERTKFQQGVVRRYYEHFDTIALQRLSELVSEIYIAEANKPVKLWERVKALLSRVASEDERVAAIVAKKDIQGLARLTNELSAGLKERKSSGGTPTTSLPSPVDSAHSFADQSAPISPAPAADVLSPDNLKRAMKAFRKRMKLTRLDDESRLGRSNNPMSGGRKSQVDAIMPPREFPKQVWDELVNQKKLTTTDGVFYCVIEGA